MKYEFVWTPIARRQLRAIPQPAALALLTALTLLGDDPYRRDGVDVKALTGRSGYRLRVGDYRLVYRVDDGKLIVLVVAAGHRREVYER
ncbi:type II toxin-antitoxin system RelE family toxin [Nocardia arthritidis]|uniref:Type II toxin-antitoxin system RelE/ParE family toxin n=1 Tax=Nocardia arthritidis TaxID=228602 RepID=A0A6G9Y8Y2_9NOCA|nr:type II toxin-antitoxin system RelE/ParE family toxin [Nocardia arthritidis]QIS09537.1 type II toxin-antitoxin system RelE/ParE family toxin [Nocardia arthritidis]